MFPNPDSALSRLTLGAFWAGASTGLWSSGRLPIERQELNCDVTCRGGGLGLGKDGPEDIPTAMIYKDQSGLFDLFEQLDRLAIGRRADQAILVRIAHCVGCGRSGNNETAGTGARGKDELFEKGTPASVQHHHHRVRLWSCARKGDGAAALRSARGVDERDGL